MKLKFVYVLIFCLLVGCSNTKNTPATRGFHNVTSRYNVYFNAGEYYKKGVENINTNLICDYTEILPVYKLDGNGAADIAKSDLETCIQKCGKNILTHSITAKPKKKYSRAGMDENQQAFYNKPEYCKWIDDTYLLMGKANYILGELDRAESSFQLGITRFKHEPTKFEAQLWLAKTFWAQKNNVEALDLLTKLDKDLRHPKKINADIKKIYADIYISEKNYTKAIENIQQAVELTKGKNNKAWLYYILGDLNRLNGNYPEAQKYYTQVVKMHPEYSLAFNSKINLATVFTNPDDIENIKKDLEKLLADEKNKEYNRQIYYALAELNRRNNNTQDAIKYYRLSAATAQNNDVQKAKSYLGAAKLYFNIPDYINAGEFFDSTMTYLPKTYSGYDEISQTASTLSLLIKNINQAMYQDSIQRVAQMSEPERNKLINKIIAQVKADEQAALAAKNNPYYQGGGNNAYGVTSTGQDGNPNFQGRWYLYNSTALNYGRAEFNKKWGSRPLEDNWRRSNKTVEASTDNDDQENQDGDSLLTNKMPEYYLRNLPLTDSAMTVSKNTEAESWFAVADIYSAKMNDKNKAIETLLHLNKKNPEHYLMPQSYYMLYNLYNEIGEQSLAAYYKQLLIGKYPESGYAKILNDKNYLKTVEERKNTALQKYDQALQQFNNKEYNLCIQLCNAGRKEYADLPVATNFLYLKAKAEGRSHNIEAMKADLTEIVEKNPGTSIAKNAQNKLDAINSGNFNYEKFSTSTFGNYYVAIVYNKSAATQINVNFITLNFCAENGFADKDVEEQNFNNDIKIVKISNFNGNESAMEFYPKYYNYISSKLNINEYKIFTISDTNYKKLENQEDINAYYNFFLSNK